MISEVELIEYLKRIISESSQLEIANQIGISPQYLNDIINFRRSPGPKVYQALNLKRVIMYEALD